MQYLMDVYTHYTPICMHIPICCGIGLLLAMLCLESHVLDVSLIMIAKRRRLVFSFLVFLSVVCSRQGYLMLSHQGLLLHPERREAALPLKGMVDWLDMKANCVKST